MTPRQLFEVHRRDLDGHAGAVEIELSPDHFGATTTGHTFEEAKAAMVEELRSAMAMAERLEEPTP